MGDVPEHVCSGIGHQRHLLSSQHRVLVNLHGLCTEGETQHPTPCVRRSQRTGQCGLGPFGSERRLSLSRSPRSHQYPRINTPESLFQYPDGTSGAGGDPGHPGPRGIDTGRSRVPARPPSTHAHRPRASLSRNVWRHRSSSCDPAPFVPRPRTASPLPRPHCPAQRLSEAPPLPRPRSSRCPIAVRTFTLSPPPLCPRSYFLWTRLFPARPRPSNAPTHFPCHAPVWVPPIHAYAPSRPRPIPVPCPLPFPNRCRCLRPVPPRGPVTCAEGPTQGSACAVSAPARPGAGLPARSAAASEGPGVPGSGGRDTALRGGLGAVLCGDSVR